jgi:predicted DNA-binding ribbon-helix-helix protein
MSFARARAQLRAIYVHGHPASVRIEQKWWNMLREIAATNGVTIKSLLEGVIATKGNESLASALRFYIAQYWRDTKAPYYFLDVTHGTRSPRSQQRGIGDTGRPPRPKSA